MPPLLCSEPPKSTLSASIDCGTRPGILARVELPNLLCRKCVTLRRRGKPRPPSDPGLILRRSVYGSILRASGFLSGGGGGSILCAPNELSFQKSVALKRESQ